MSGMSFERVERDTVLSTGCFSLKCDSCLEPLHDTDFVGTELAAEMPARDPSIERVPVVWMESPEGIAEIARKAGWLVEDDGSALCRKCRRQN